MLIACLSLLVTALSLLAIPSFAAAETQLPRIIDEDMTWTEAGSPYVGDSSDILPGVTVTVEPGVTTKLSGKLNVDGTLNVDGSPGNHVLFTSIEDSAPGQWGGIDFWEGSTGSIDYADLRYGGSVIGYMMQTVEDISITNSTFTWTIGFGIYVKGGAPTITDNTFSDNSVGIVVLGPSEPIISGNTIERGQLGISYYGSPWAPSGPMHVTGNTIRNNGGNGLLINMVGGFGWQGGEVTGNTITNNSGRAIYLEGGGPLGGIPQEINQNTATGNGCNCVYLDQVHITEPTTWRPGLTFVLGGAVNILSPLTILGGVVVKGEGIHNSRLKVTLGDLEILGSAGNRVTFTSLADDSYGGDTNGDGGATQPTPADWGGITVNGPGRAIIEQARLLYGGRMDFSSDDRGMLSIKEPSWAPTSIRNSTIAHAQIGIYVYEFGGPLPVVMNNTIRDNFSQGVYKLPGAILEAPDNDWGCDSGPRPFGCGDRVNEYVLPTPFATREEVNDNLFGTEAQGGEGAEPVSMSTGSFFHSHTDLQLTGKSNPLEFTRTYNSQDGADAGLGRGWSHNALLVASELESGDVDIRRADGRRDTYTFTDPDYDPPSGIHDALVKNPDATFTLTTLDRTVYNFDQTGRIASITDDHDQAITYDYDGNGRLASMTDSSDQSLSFAYNSTNYITSVSDSTGRTVAYTYDADGNLETVTDPLNGVATYTYDSADRMTSIKDPEDRTFITNTYDTQDRVVSQQDGEGNDWSISYQEGQTEVTEPEGGTKIYNFDTALRVTSETDQIGNTTSYRYDSNGNIDQITRPGGAQYSFTYDSDGNLVSETHPESGTRTYTYDAQNRLTDHTDARSNSWSFTWSAANDLTDVIDPKANTTSLTYDSAGLPLTITDPENHTTAFAYDSRGNLTSSTNPLNDETTYTYDARNYQTSKTEPGKNPATYDRNALGDLLSTTDPESSTTGFTYNKNGELLTLTDPESNTWQIERNLLDRPTAIIDPKLNRTEISYDANLNPTSVTDRRGNTTSYTYDPANRITLITRPEGGIYSFDYNARGNVAALTDPRNKTSSYTYDLVDRLTNVDEPEATSTSYTYDTEHNLTSTTDPRNSTTSYTYDSLNLMTQMDQPLGKQTSYTYDKVQNQKTKTTAAGTLDYQYDAADQLTNIKEGAQTLRSFGYDPIGRLDQATDDAGTTIAVQYDQVDRPTQITDGLGQTTNRSYDANGNLTSQADSRGTIGYAYDELDRLTSLTDPQSQAVSFDYDNEGNLITQGLPNAVDTVNTFDKDGRMTRTKSTKSTSILQDFKYTYDTVGNPTSKQDKGGRRTSYSYDGLNRLTRESTGRLACKKRPSTTNRRRYCLSRIRRKQDRFTSYSKLYRFTNYAYDKAGNRTRAGSKEYAYDALNQLQSSTDGTTYAYDGAGRLTQKTKGVDTTTFSWDLLDELTQVQDPQGTTTYSYDALNRRSAKTAGGNTEIAHYGDLADVPTFDTDGTGQLTTSYVSAWPDVSSHTDTTNNLLSSQVNLSRQASIDQVLGPVAPINPVKGLSGTKDPAGLVEERENSQTSYPLADAHGDITAVTDSAGSVSSSHSYDPWGIQNSASQREMGYLGAYLRRSDLDTGLTQMGARQYEPSLARFMSEDRVLGRSSMGQSWNRHSYVYNRPLVLYDLDGEIPCLVGPLRPICRKLIIEGGKAGARAIRSITWKDVKNFGIGCVGGAGGVLLVVTPSTPAPAVWVVAGVGGCVFGGTSQAVTGTNWIPPM